MALPESEVAVRARFKATILALVYCSTCLPVCLLADDAGDAVELLSLSLGCPLPLKVRDECPTCEVARDLTTQKYIGDAGKFALSQHIDERTMHRNSGEIIAASIEESYSAAYGTFDAIKGGSDVQVSITCRKDRFCIDETWKFPNGESSSGAQSIKRTTIEFCDSKMRDNAIVALTILNPSSSPTLEDLGLMDISGAKPKRKK